MIETFIQNSDLQKLQDLRIQLSLNLNQPFLGIIAVDTLELARVFVTWLKSVVEEQELEIHNISNPADINNALQSTEKNTKVLVFPILPQPSVNLIKTILFRRDYIAYKKLRVILIISHADQNYLSRKAFDLLSVAQFNEVFTDKLAEFKRDIITSTENKWQKQLDKFLEQYENAKKQKHSQRYILRLLYNIGLSASKLGKNSMAENYLKKALKIATELNNLQYLCYIYSEIGTLYQKQAHYQKALDFYNKSKVYAKKMNDKELQLKILGNIASVYYATARFSEALEIFQTIAKESDKFSDPITLSAAYLYIGAIYKHLGNTRQAIEFFKKAHKLKVKYDDRHGLAVLYNYIGNLLLNTGLVDKALKYHKKSLKIKVELGDSAGIANSLNNIASIYRYKGEFNLASNYLEYALKVSTNNTETEIIYLNKAYLNLLTGDISTAVKLLSKIRQTQSKHKTSLLLTTVKAEIDYRKGDLLNAQRKLKALLTSDSSKLFFFNFIYAKILQIAIAIKSKQENFDFYGQFSELEQLTHQACFHGLNIKVKAMRILYKSQNEGINAEDLQQLNSLISFSQQLNQKILSIQLNYWKAIIYHKLTKTIQALKIISEIEDQARDANYKIILPYLYYQHAQLLTTEQKKGLAQIFSSQASELAEQLNIKGDLDLFI